MTRIFQKYSKNDKASIVYIANNKPFKNINYIIVASSSPVPATIGGFLPPFLF